MDCDVLIVGGGPAGTIAALALARDHHHLAERTLLIEAAAQGDRRRDHPEVQLLPRETADRRHSLLLDSVCCDEAPLLYGADEMEQNSADATARKLHAFLKKTAS